MRLLPLILLIPMLAAPLPASTATLSQEECIRLAVSQNSGLQSLAATSAAAAEEITISQSALLPTLSLKSYYTLQDKADRLIVDTDAFGPGFPSQNTSLSIGSTDTYGIQLSLRQRLFAGGALIAAHQRAGHEAAAAAHDYSRQTTLLIFRIKKAYNEVLIADNRIQAAEKAVQAAEERLRVATVRQHEGYLQQDEVLRHEAQLAMTQSRLIKSQNRSHLVRGKLRQLIGLEQGTEFTVAGLPARLKLEVSLQELIQGSLERREDISSSTEKRAAAEAGIRIARSEFLPQIYMEGNYLRQKESSIARPEIWSLSLQAEWSLFDWGRTSSSVRRAVARHSSQDRAGEELRRAARFEIEEAWRDVLEQQSLVTANEKMVKAEEATLVRTIVRWSEGSARLDDVISSEAALWEAYDNYCQSAASLNSAFAALEAATSGALARWTTQENLHRPDFENYALLIKASAPTEPQVPQSPAQSEAGTPTPQLPQNPSPVTPQKESIREPASLNLPHTDALPTPTSMHPPDDQQQKMLKSISSPSTPADRYRLQLGGYLSHGKARQAMPAAASRTREDRIEIVADGKFFKLLAGPYASSAQARQAAVRLGATEYLLRSEHGSR